MSIHTRQHLFLTLDNASCDKGQAEAQRGNERLAKHLHKHGDPLCTFLRPPGIDATHRRAEQAIRTAAVKRKVWGGNRTRADPEARSILTSILRTFVRQHCGARDVVSRSLRRRPALVPTRHPTRY